VFCSLVDYIYCILLFALAFSGVSRPQWPWGRKNQGLPMASTTELGGRVKGEVHQEGARGPAEQDLALVPPPTLGKRGVPSDPCI
jgi:hypothetical protein